jgi:hypothetical protein
MVPGLPRGLVLVPLFYFATIGLLWVVTESKKADQQQQAAVACTASQNAIALLIAAAWDMRAAEMDPVIPTMNELSECEFRFFETDWRTTNEYSMEQVSPTTFTGKTGCTSYTITFRDPRMVNVGCLSAMTRNTFKVPPRATDAESAAPAPGPDPSSGSASSSAGTDPAVRRQLTLAESTLRQPQLTGPRGLHSSTGLASPRRLEVDTDATDHPGPAVSESFSVSFRVTGATGPGSSQESGSESGSSASIGQRVYSRQAFLQAALRAVPAGVTVRSASS